MNTRRDPLGRDRQVTPVRKNPPPQQTPTETVDARRLKVWKLRTEKNMSVAEIAKRLGVTIDTIYGDLNHKHEQVLSAVSEYGQFRRNENERQIEALKELYAGYLFNPNVVIRGTEVDKDGKTRVIELSHFDAMLKVSTLYLAALNIQNKIWNLYAAPESDARHDATTLNVKNVNVAAMVQEIQRIARKETCCHPQRRPLLRMITHDSTERWWPSHHTLDLHATPP
jgi:transcriptional regulator with XRE-family HTH domain